MQDKVVLCVIIAVNGIALPGFFNCFTFEVLYLINGAIRSNLNTAHLHWATFSAYRFSSSETFWHSHGTSRYGSSCCSQRHVLSCSALAQYFCRLLVDAAYVLQAILHFVHTVIALVPFRLYLQPFYIVLVKVVDFHSEMKRVHPINLWQNLPVT